MGLSGSEGGVALTRHPYPYQRFAFPLLERRIVSGPTVKGRSRSEQAD